MFHFTDHHPFPDIQLFKMVLYRWLLCLGRCCRRFMYVSFHHSSRLLNLCSQDLLSLRTKALYPSSKLLNYFTFTLYAACFGAAAVLIAIQGTIPLHGLDVIPYSPTRLATGCLYTNNFTYLHYVWICHLVFETWITVLTLIKAVEQRAFPSPSP